MKFYRAYSNAGTIRTGMIINGDRLPTNRLAEMRQMLLSPSDQFIPHPIAGTDFAIQLASEDNVAAIAALQQQGRDIIAYALLSGVNDQADQNVTRCMQKLTTRVFANTPAEPGFDIALVVSRPIIIGTPLPARIEGTDVLVALNAHSDFQLIAEIELCLAAAFFEHACAW